MVLVIFQPERLEVGMGLSPNQEAAGVSFLTVLPRTPISSFFSKINTSLQVLACGRTVG